MLVDVEQALACYPQVCLLLTGIFDFILPIRGKTEGLRGGGGGGAVVIR